MLADLGADVIKVEPPAGDLTRFAAPRVNGLATYFVQQNVGKRNVSIDLSTAAWRAARRRPRRALRRAHRELPRRGDAAPRARAGRSAARYPRLVYASITGYGATGPWAHRRAYAPVVGAESGLTKAQGDARGAVYANDPASHADVYTALEVATAAARRAVPARAHRARPVDRRVDGRDDALRQRAPPRPAVGRDGGRRDHPQLLPGRLPRASSSPTGTPSSSAGTPPSAARSSCSSRALGARAPRRRSALRRRRRPAGQLRRPAADAARRGRARSPTRRRSRSSSAPTSSPSACCARHASWPRRTGRASAGRSPRCPIEATGTIRIPNPPWHFSDADDRGARSRPRYRGEDNREVLAELLGYDDATIDELESDGVITSRVPTSRHVTLSFPVAPMKAALGTLPDARTRGGRTRSSGTATARSPSSRAAGSGCRARTCIDVTAKYPEMQELAGAIGVRRVVLDGELVVLDDDGQAAVRADPAPRHRQAGGRVLRLRRAVDRRPRHHLAALRGPPAAARRRARRRTELGGAGAPHRRRRRRCSTLTEARDLEGVMAKRLGTSYRPGARSKDWRKVKHRRRAEVVIGGYTPGAGCGPAASAPCSSGGGSTVTWRSPAASGPGSRSAGSTSSASASPSWRPTSARSTRSRRRRTAAARCGSNRC